MRRKQKLVTLVDKKADSLLIELQRFKYKFWILHKKEFPPIFDGNRNVYPKESQMKVLGEMRNDKKGFREEYHLLQGKYILNMYLDYF